MRQRLVPPHRDQGGFTLVEVMVAALVLVIGVLATMTMLDGANRVQRENNVRTNATALARDILERARAIEYQAIAQSGTGGGNVVNSLREKSTLHGRIDANGRWVINRRGVDYVVSTTTCTFDDPSDGLGSPAPVNPCPAGTGATGAVDSNPDDFRRLVVALTWQRGSKTHQVVHTTQIINPGGGLGPRITSFPDPNGGLQIGDHAGSGTGPAAITLRAESTIAHTVRWAVDDGRSSGTANATEAGGKKWDWEWKIGTVDVGTPGVDWALDGSYAANAQAFDSRGVPGELRVANVLLNRRQALMPKLMGAGRSGGGTGGSQLVEMDWVPSPERDVIGYRVYRLRPDGTGAVDKRICPLAGAAGDQVIKASSCTDEEPPGESAQPTILYKIVAVDRPVLGDISSGTHEGDARMVSVGLTGRRLERPTNLMTTTESGRPKLSWTAPPVPLNPTTGQPEKILFYRIYRDGLRYTRTVSDATTFVDTTPLATTHRYMVSAVHESYNEGKLSDERSWP